MDRLMKTSLTFPASVAKPFQVRLATGELAGIHPPTIRQRVEIELAIRHCMVGDEEDLLILFGHLEAWLPEDVVLDLFFLDAGPLLARVSELLDAHVRAAMMEIEEKQKDPSTDGKEGKKEGADIRLALWDYAQVLGGADPWHIYNETPWPFFVVMSVLRETASARQLLRMAEVEILPHTGKAAQKGIESLRERAGIQKPGTASDGHGLHAPPEVIEADRRRLRELFGAPSPKQPGS